MHIIIFGSSITWGAWDKEGGWAQRIKSLADKKAAESNYNDEYTTVYCLGVSGDNTEDLLRRYEIELKARLSEDEKNLVLIEIGINDSQFILNENKHRVSKEDYRENLLKLSEITKSQGANLIFVGLTPVDSRVDPIPWKQSATYRLDFIKKYDSILKDVCEEQNLPFIELLSKFDNKDYQNLLTDGLHPSTEGHKIMFEEVKNYLESKNLL